MMHAAFLLPLLVYTAIAGAETLELGNSLVTAYLNKSSCQLLSVQATGPSSPEYSVSGDDLALELPGSGELRLSQLTLASVSVTPAQITCRFQPVWDLALVLTFEAQPGWDFVGRRASLVGAENASNATHQIGSITAFSASVTHQGGAGLDALFSTAAGGIFLRTTAAQQLGDNDWSEKVTGGLMVVVQNNFADEPSAGSTSIQYNAALEHDFTKVPFSVDMVLFAPYTVLAAHGTVPLPASGLVLGEYFRFWSVAEAFLLTPPSARVGTTKIHVPWTANFLEEVDINNPENLEQAHRVILRCAELGIKHILWSAQDGAVSAPINATDAWDWGASLWLTLGERIGAGSFFPSAPDAVLPSSTAALIAFAKSQGVYLMPYIYPSDGMRFTPQGKPAPWVFQGSHRGSCPLPACHESLPSPSPCAYCYNSLASREFQDFLMTEIGAFVDLADADGAGFDYTFINDGATSAYAQWAGWRRILSGVLSSRPTLQVDNRQSNHAWGPWMWVSTGTYAEPLQSDEQPESWQAFTPDLHTARLTANRMRQMNFDYRYSKLCPAAVAPGFFSHQTDMQNSTHKRAWENNRFARDFDYFGYKYALLSSVGSAGLNNVVNMLPARDLEEYKKFPAADLNFIKTWLDWTDANVALLGQAFPLPVAPGLGVVDGTVMAINSTGYIFLFNPNSAVAASPSMTLDVSLGFECGTENLLVAEIFPVPRNLSLQACGTKLVLPDRDGKSATVLSIRPFSQVNSSNAPLLLGAQGTATATTLANTADLLVSVADLLGERGTVSEIQLVLTRPAVSVVQLVVNGHNVPFTLTRYGSGLLERTVVQATLRHGGLDTAQPRFRRSQRVNGTITGRVFNGNFTVPKEVFHQLAVRNTTYPVNWTQDDLSASWLSPGRLLLFVDGTSVTLEAGSALKVTAEVDGISHPVLRSYNCRGERAPKCYNGPYLDLTTAAADVSHSITVTFPDAPLPLQISGLFFENVAPLMTSELEI